MNFQLLVEYINPSMEGIIQGNCRLDATPGKNIETMSKFPVPTVKYTQLFYNGQFVDSKLKRVFPSINPFTGKIIASLQEAGRDDVDSAVMWAQKAFEIWRKMDASKRGRLLTKLGDLIEKNLETLAGLDSLENGIPIMESLHTVGAAAEIFRFYGGLADKIKGDTIPADGNILTMTIKEPMGVAAIIIPWNSPSLMLAKTVGPALAAGNTVIVKPAEQTCLSALFLASLTLELTDLPPGVFNVLPGEGKTGAFLAEHTSIEKITFTGSTEVGQSILAASARSNLKRVTLELGGKSPLVIFDDVDDIEKAAELAFAALFVSNGQVCCCGSRTYVQEGIYDRFVEATAKLAQSRVLGDPFSRETQQGPQINREAVEKITRMIECGRREGARLVTGGGKLEGEEKSLFVQPTVFADVNEGMTIGREEIFGPVQQIFKFTTMEDIIEKANMTRFGLASGVVTKNIQRALTFAKAVRAGSVWINCYFVVRPQTPFGGYKMSGFGREFGEAAINEYVETKTITINLGETLTFG